VKTKKYYKLMLAVNSKIFALCLCLLMIALAFAATPNIANNANAQTTTSTIPANLLQYEWRQTTSDASRSFASAGPGPNSSYIKWRTQIPKVMSPPVAFSGKLFVSQDPIYFGAGVRSTYALDAGTGEILWTAQGIFGAIAKLDDTYMMIGSNAYKIADGSLAWKGPTGFTFSVTELMGVGYDPASQTFFTGTQAWRLSSPSQPPTLLWDRANETDYRRYGTETAKVYSNGILVYNTNYNYVLGVNAVTGKTLWVTPTTINSWTYAFSVQSGVVGFGALDGNFYGWNLTTGNLMWKYNPGTYMNQFASEPGAAYGMFYEHNEDTYVYAINATTGQLVWRAKGPGIAYSNTLTIAGGKVYIQMGENQYVDFTTGEPGYSKFDAFDAFTGKLIWTMPFENSSPFNTQCNAYGNLYVVPMVSSYHAGDFVYAYAFPDGGIGGSDGGLGEVWCISDTPQDWSMFANDPAHSAFGNGPTNLKLTWKVTPGINMLSSPTLVNGVAYVGTFDGNIYALKTSTGEKIWSYPLGKIGFTSTLAVVNNKVYTGADDGNVYALDASTGNKLWQASAGGTSATGSPTVAGGKVYVAGGNNNIYAFDATTGTVIWNYDAKGSVSSQCPAVLDGAVYVGAAISGGGGPHVLKLNATTGALIFDTIIPGFNNATTISASVTTGGGMVFARGTYRYNYALNATTGKIIWKIDSRYNPGTPEQATGTQQSSIMLYQYGRVYFNNFYGLSCVNAFNGTELWYSWLSRENFATGFSYSYGRIYTPNENGALYVLDSLTGKKLSYYEFDNNAAASLHSIPTPYNGSLYVTALNWNLYRFDEAPPAAPYAPQPTPTPLTADQIAQKVLEKLPAYPTSPSADEVAKKVLASLPSYPTGVSVDELAQKVLASLPANPSAEQIAQEICNQLSTKNVLTPAEPTPTNVVIMAGVVVAIAIGAVNLYLIRKRK
jgi:outer membrane protein assembly factor BamB